MSWASVASVVGQMSGQFVKPKKTSVQRFAKKSGPSGRPSWSVSAIGGNARGDGSTVARSVCGAGGVAGQNALARKSPAANATIVRMPILNGRAAMVRYWEKVRTDGTAIIPQ